MSWHAMARGPLPYSKYYDEERARIFSKWKRIAFHCVPPSYISHPCIFLRPSVIRRKLGLRPKHGLRGARFMRLLRCLVVS
jgi:hypothetical protein